MTATRLLTIYVEIVEDRRSGWQAVRVGKTWTTKPEQHAGRVIRVDLRRLRGYIDIYFLRGRRRFDRPGWTAPAKGDRPPFGLVVVVMRGRQ